ncbi:DUF7341 domain-containing protein, partial [Thermocatellispora tengchongensis]|uniref:DUF7341 domain-containing protein n=1 Tax=Thermocatellispora tengchongensis TaxID=1073253 RepID=UPI0031F0E4C8
ERPSLLEQLRGAVKPDAGGGAAGSDGARLPVDVGAVSLLQDIERSARAEHQELFETQHGTLEQVIQRFATVTHPEWVDYLARVTGEWATSIDRYLRPRKPRRRLHQPCPACGVKYHGEERTPTLTLNCWGEDEETLPPAEWDAACGACGAEWRGEEITWFVGALRCA